MDSALTLHTPIGVDSGTMTTAEWRTLTDCGDMTGTGSSVICLSGLDFLSGIFAFYVIDEKPDELVDMFIGGFNLGGFVDTCTIDRDGLQDFAIGATSWNPNYNSTDYNGTVLFIHGSKSIPVPSSSVRTSGVEQPRLWVRSIEDGHALAIQASEAEVGDIATLQLFDMLGRMLFTNEAILAGDRERVVPIPHFANGTYILRLGTRGKSYMEKLVL